MTPSAASPALDPNALEKDEWLSNIMGLSAFKLNLNKLHAFTEPPSPSFIYTKIPAEEIKKVIELENRGFHLIDSNVQFERKEYARAANLPSNIRFSLPSDEDAVAKLAAEAFRFSRFHLDPQIPSALANKIKAEWARNYFLGKRGKFMVVATDNSTISGFLQLLQPSNSELIIDLIAVSESARGKGYAKAMIEFAQTHIPDINRIIVGTQLANVPSIRLYEGLGFKFLNASYVMHLHKK